MDKIPRVAHVEKILEIQFVERSLCLVLLDTAAVIIPNDINTYLTEAL